VDDGKLVAIPQGHGNSQQGAAQTSQEDHEHSLFGKHWGCDLPLEDSELERIKGLSPEDIASAVDSATELLKKELEEQVKELIQGGRAAEQAGAQQRG
jgi:hypothetical protein